MKDKYKIFIKKWIKRSAIFFSGLLLIWIVWANVGMKMRKSDKKTISEFQALHIPLQISEAGDANHAIHYLKTGSDSLPTLLFIHGSPGSWDAYEQYLKDAELRQKFRLISVDRPGFGYSLNGKAYHLQEQGELLYEVVKKENHGKPIHLIGHSIGGPVVMCMAQQQPQAYASLTILAGSISPYAEEKESWRYPMHYFPLRYLVPGVLRTSNDEIIYFKKDLYELDKNYDKLHMPITFIHGDKDPLVNVSNVKYGMDKMHHAQNLQQIIIPGANHFIPWEHYDLIKKHLLTLE
jgi:hypothetical protein